MARCTVRYPRVETVEKTWQFYSVCCVPAVRRKWVSLNTAHRASGRENWCKHLTWTDSNNDNHHNPPNIILFPPSFPFPLSFHLTQLPDGYYPAAPAPLITSRTPILPRSNPTVCSHTLLTLTNVPTPCRTASSSPIFPHTRPHHRQA